MDEQRLAKSPNRAFLDQLTPIFLGRHWTVGITVSLLALVAFGVIAASVKNRRPWVEVDGAIHDKIPLAEYETTYTDPLMSGITELGSDRTMLGLAVVVTLVLALGRQWLMAAAIVPLGVAGGLLNVALKTALHVPRPPDSGHGSFGFPSGHSMGAMIGYGLLAYLPIVFLIRRPGTRMGVVALFGLLVGLIGFSRIYLHAHYFTQVIGGFAAGTAWLALSICLLEGIRRHPFQFNFARQPNIETSQKLPESQIYF